MQPGPPSDDADEQGAAAPGRVHDRQYVLCGRVDGWTRSDAVGKADAAPVEQDQATDTRNRRDPRAAAAVFPDPLHMRNEARNEHDVRRTTADGLEREVDTVHFDIARSRRFRVALLGSCNKASGSRVKGHAKLFSQVPGACFELALGCRPVPGRQVGTDQMAVRAFA